MLPTVVPLRLLLLLLLLLGSAIPISFIYYLELSSFRSSNSYCYQTRSRSGGWLRESAKWDAPNNRFIVSFFEGGIGQISITDHLPPPDHHHHHHHHQSSSNSNIINATATVVLKEETLVSGISADHDHDHVDGAAAAAAGSASFLGLVVDGERNRVVVALADVISGRYGGVAAYDMETWRRIFLTNLSTTGPDDEKSLADDVAVDAYGNVYVTDAKGNKIWKVGVNGQLLSTIIINRDAFNLQGFLSNLVGLNGIVYHPDGFLLVIHTSKGILFKVDTETESVTKVDVKGSLVLGDGLELVSSTTLAVAGTPSGRLVESSDGWLTATVVAKYVGPLHRLATSATVKDGKVYLSHLLGFFGGRKHVIVEAIFSPCNSSCGFF